MRKRLVASLWQSQDVCIFCAGRSAQRSILRSETRPFVRNYQTSQSVRRPAGAAAAEKQDDDDEDEFPLLKQNASQGTTQPFSASAEQNALPSVQRHAPTRGPRINIPRRVGSVDSTSHAQPRRESYSFKAVPQDSSDTPMRFTMNQGRDVSGQRRSSRPDPPPRDSDAGQARIRWTSPSRGNNREQYYGERLPSQSRRVDSGALPLRYQAVDSQAPRSQPNEERIPRHNYSPRSESKTVTSGQSSRVRYDPIQGGPISNRTNRRSRNDADNNLQDAAVSLQDGPDLDIDENSTIDLPATHTSRGSKLRKTRADRFVIDSYEPPTPSPSKSWSRKQSQPLDFDLLEAEATSLGERRGKKSKKPVVEAVKPKLVIPDFISVEKLAQSLKVKVDDLVARLEEEGFEGARYDHILDAETSSMFADMYGFDVAVVEAGPVEDLIATLPPKDTSALPTRPPIVTIMGHVDHGKTTILDYLRKASVAAGEHGGITQHIGAFSVLMPGSERHITFLDTPGHEAFLDMRRRGATVTDIVVLVVAADDSVKPQTIEAIKHALDARVQIIVAINKVDKNDANVERVKQDLTRHDIVVEDYGGDYQAIPVSGKTGQGMRELEDAILTLADVLDFRAEKDGQAEGTIIESKVTNAGRVATILVRRGTLRPGDFIVAGNTWARVRTLRNDNGQLVEEALPGDPVQVDGWRGEDPTAGLEVLQAENEQHAKNVVDLRLEKIHAAQTTADTAAINAARSLEAEARTKVLAWEAENAINPKRRRDNEGWVDNGVTTGPKNVHFIIKADVAGSVEALVAAVSAIGNHEIKANIIHSGTGLVVESDIRMLAATGEEGYAISFNQPVDGQMYRLAEAAKLMILNHNIIYKVTDDVKIRLQDALPPLITQRVLGEAEIDKVFEVTLKKKMARIAGCRVTNGIINRSNKVRVVRGGETVYTGQFESLKNVKKDVDEMRKGTECGMGFKDWEDFQEGDQVQCFEEKEEKRKLY